MAELKQIVLSIARTLAGNTFSVGRNEPADPSLRTRTFERDDHTCGFCGFRSLKYQDIHFLNGNPEDGRPGNVITTCLFCHQCFNLESVAAMKSGMLIWLPEIDQATLHHVVRAAYVARISQGPIAEAARHCLDLFMRRREEARKRLGTDDPYTLAAVLRDYITDRTYERRAEKLEGIRLFPLDRRIIREADLEFNQFPQILAFWRSKEGPFGGVVLKEWMGLYRNVMNIKAA